MSPRSLAAEYRQNHIEGTVMDADPHKLVSLLLAGACDRIRLAEACLEQGDQARKGKAIGEACAIVGHLDGSLDHEAGGEIAGNLSALYDYVVRRLTAANLHNDGEGLRESLALLAEVDAAWNAIPEQQRQLQASGGAA
ncbi:flagellar export chaperone FliS [Luteimonas sp. RD2P54]|uniref:Flagellar secretion chaperone FliS n=1 Tax=Luteimonas endophytica TaxID=3042023 RepID=A0ABT6J7G6_9GAMM|nr:flagellar export chaperone FliS [Luteimonas endophytica]MDH5822756.1 flagellar export chaperone FliS [Luteimonas endophytica]